jgi:phosphoribosyl 1,2-cyclic phosphodiesterase
MSTEFTVLASGSSGNAALLRVPGYGLLIDCGIGPRVFTERLRSAAASWSSISAVLLTHTHSDHWNRATFFQLHRLRIPILLHPAHEEYLEQYSSEFPTLQKANLIRHYELNKPLSLTDSLQVLPIRVPHDSEPTVAFRIDVFDRTTAQYSSLGYASDLGCVTENLLAAFQDVSTLAIEFNHDVPMQRQSRRTQLLIDRVLGEKGHLSNEQAAEFLQQRIANRTQPLQTVIQLHLSRECNTPDLAYQVGHALLAAHSPETRLITARQDRPTPTISLGTHSLHGSTTSLPQRSRSATQPCLPGME